VSDPVSDPVSDLGGKLSAEGLWARRSLGQHFLLDPSINARIAALAGPLAGETVLEIGPGPGGLTRALLAAGAARVIAIEKDRRFAAFLGALAGQANGRLEIVEADALGVDEAALLAKAGAARAMIVANLPYNVATPLLTKWLKAGPWRGPMILMFQKEVAERIVAAPGESAYGRLAVLAQAVCMGEIVMRLPPGAFTPPPKVESAIVRLDALSAPYAHLDALERVTAAAFGQRRKMLRASLARLLGAAAAPALTALGIDPAQRAETLTIAQFTALTDALIARGALRG
jgi:16S rRNA (adenine1518-N6/adenine1519-N6)-dimethyltransferase